MGRKAVGQGGGAKKNSKRPNSKAGAAANGSAKVDPKVAKEVEELRNKSIKSFKKGATTKATPPRRPAKKSQYALHPEPPCAPISQAFKDMANAIKQLPEDPLNYMVRAALYHELEQVRGLAPWVVAGCCFVCRSCVLSVCALQCGCSLRPDSPTEKPASQRREAGPGHRPTVLARLLL